jgi:uncharacterized membrane protein
VSERALRAATVGAALAGAALTTYLLSVRWGGGELICSTGGCEAVQSSRYAEVLGIPVAALGLAAYVAIGALALLAAPTARAAALSLSLAAMIFSGYLLVVQVAVIGEFCRWCLLNDGLVTLLAALVVAGAMPRSRSGPSPVRTARARPGRRGAASA